MSGEKKRRRWRQRPVLIEENITIDSKSSTTITTRSEEQKHTENTRRQWYQKKEDEQTYPQESPSTIFLPNEKLSEKIDRVLRKINAWTNETSPTATNHNNIQRESLQDTSFNKTNLSAYDNICQGQQNESQPIGNSFRQRCCSSTYTNSNMGKNPQISIPRPYSTIYIDESLSPTASCLTKDKNNYLHEGQQERKVRGRISLKK